MKPIVNTEDELIKSYLKIREKLIEKFKNSKLYDENENFKNVWIERVNESGNVDSLLYNYDKNLLFDKLSEKSKKLFDGYDPIIIIVADDFILYEHRYGIESFKTEDERYEWLKQFSEDNDYDALEDFSQIDLKEIEGNIDDNTEKIIKNAENCIITFIKASSIFSDNIIVGIEKY